MIPRVFAGGVATETNVFSPLPTGILDFDRAAPNDPDDRRAQLAAGSVFQYFRKATESRGGIYLQGSYAFAQPAGITARAAYETLRDALLLELENALHVDCVLLALHGA